MTDLERELMKHLKALVELVEDDWTRDGGCLFTPCCRLPRGQHGNCPVGRAKAVISRAEGA